MNLVDLWPIGTVSFTRQCSGHAISGASGSKTGFDLLVHTVSGMFRLKQSFAEMDRVQLPLERALSCSFSSTDDQWGVCPASLQKTQSFTACSERKEMRDLACAHGLSLTPCYAMLTDQGFQSHAWVPDLFWKPRFPSLHLPALPKQGHKSPHFSMGCKTSVPSCLVNDLRTNLPSCRKFLSPGSSNSSNLPEISVFMWDQHAGPNVFPPGFWKVRTAVYWISKHTDHTALLAH